MRMPRLESIPKVRRGKHPKTLENLKPYPKVCEEKCARKPVQVKIPASHYEAWMTLSTEKRNTYLRDAIASLLEEENLLPN